MKKKLLFAALTTALILAGCSAAQSGNGAQANAVSIDNPYAPQPGDGAMLQGDVAVESARWDVETQSLLITGNLAASCDQLRATVSQNGKRIDFTLYAVTEVDVMCAQMLQPYEAIFKMDSFSPEDYTVFVNGQEMPL
jgi:ethanolamine utilization microcompartment shell protein EutS